MFSLEIRQKTAGSIVDIPKNSKPPTHTVYDAYARSWVFDAVVPESAAGVSGVAAAATTSDAPYFEVLQNGAPKKPAAESKQKDMKNGMVSENVHLIDTPAVRVVEDASEDDRKLCHMKSFSRSHSPVVLSASSSRSSLDLSQRIYEKPNNTVETVVYRSRLNTALSGNKEKEKDCQVKEMEVARSSPRVETVQYASLMKELQKAIVHKKEPASTESSASDSASEKNLTSKSSDADFSKELEAALQLIQDLESPDTVETPASEPARPAVSPSNEEAKGKSVGIAVRYPDSQSTSGYSSPTHGPTPDWSTASSVSGSNPEIKAYSIRNTESATVISLFARDAKPRCVTLVRITGGDAPPQIHNSTFAEHAAAPGKPPAKAPEKTPQSGWKLNSLLRKKKQSSLPKMAPELEGAIVKSESLAYLSDLELLARHQRNKELQREIEKRVVQQLGAPRSTRTESNC